MKPLVVTECKKEAPRVYMLEAGRIIPNKTQPRKVFEDMDLITLADSIHRYGILQPLSVRRCDEGFVIVAGERRYRAARMLDIKELPCIILNTDPQTSAIISIIENLQRSDLNIFEEAMAIHTLKEMYSMTQEEIARTLSVSQSYVANRLRLLKLSDEEQCLVLMHGMTERHCRAILRVDKEKRKEVLCHIIECNMNVSATEAYVDKLNSAKQERKQDRRLQDLRIFYNSIDRAINSVRRLGVDIITEAVEEDKEKKLTIRILN